MSNLPPVGRKGSASSNQTSVASSQMSKEDRVLLFTDPAMMGRRGCVPDPLATWAGAPCHYEYDEQGKPNFTSRGSQSAREAVPTLPPIARKGRTQTRENKANSQSFSQTSPSPYNSTHSRTHSRSAAVTRAAPQAGRLTKDHYLHYVQTQRKSSPQKRPTTTSTQSVSEDNAVRSGESRSTSRHRSSDGLKGTRTSRALAERTHDVDLHVLAQSYRHKMSLMLSMPVHPDAVPVVLPISDNEVVRLQELKEAELARRERVAQRVKTLRKKEEEKRQREKEEEEARLEEEKERKEELRREREAMLAEARQRQKEQRRKERDERAQLLAALEAEKREREEKKKVLQATVKAIQTSRKSSTLAHNTSARADQASGGSLPPAGHGEHSHNDRGADGADAGDGDAVVDGDGDDGEGSGNGGSGGGVSDTDEYHEPEMWGASRADEEEDYETQDTTATSNTTTTAPNAATTAATAGAAGPGVGVASASSEDARGSETTAENDVDAWRDASNDYGSNDGDNEIQMQPEEDVLEAGEGVRGGMTEDMSVFDSIHAHKHVSTGNYTGEHEASEVLGETVEPDASQKTEATAQDALPALSAMRETDDVLNLEEVSGATEQVGVTRNTDDIEASEVEERREAEAAVEVRTELETRAAIQVKALEETEGVLDTIAIDAEEEFVVHGSDTDIETMQGTLNTAPQQALLLPSTPADDTAGDGDGDVAEDAVDALAGDASAGDVSVDMTLDSNTAEEEAGVPSAATVIATATTSSTAIPSMNPISTSASTSAYTFPTAATSTALPLAASLSEAATDDDLTLGEDLTAGDLDDDMLSHPGADAYAIGIDTETHQAVLATSAMSSMSTAFAAPVQPAAAEDDISLQLDNTDTTTDSTVISPADEPLSVQAAVPLAAQADVALTDDLTLGSDGDDASLRLDADTDTIVDMEVAAAVDTAALPVPIATALEAVDGDDDSIGISLNDSLNTDPDLATDPVVETVVSSAGTGKGMGMGTDASELEDDLTLDEHTPASVVTTPKTAVPTQTGMADVAVSQAHGGAAASLDMSEDDLTLGDEPTFNHTDAAAQAEVTAPVAVQAAVTPTLPPTLTPDHASVDLDGDLTLGSDATANTSVGLDDDLTLGDDTSQGVDTSATAPATLTVPASTATAAPIDTAPAPVPVSAVSVDPSLGTDLSAPDTSLALDDDLSLDEGSTAMSTADDDLAPLPTFAEKKQPDLDISTNSYELDFDMSTNLE